MDLSSVLAPIMDCAGDAATVVAARLEEETFTRVGAVRDAVAHEGSGMVSQVMSHKSLVGQVAALFNEPPGRERHQALAVLITKAE